MGSYIHDANQIFFTGTFGHDVKNQRAQQYSIEIAALDIKDQLITWAERNFSYTGFQVRQNGNGKNGTCTQDWSRVNQKMLINIDFGAVYIVRTHDFGHSGPTHPPCTHYDVIVTK